MIWRREADGGDMVVDTMFCALARALAEGNRKVKVSRGWRWIRGGRLR